MADIMTSREFIDALTLFHIVGRTGAWVPGEASS